MKNRKANLMPRTKRFLAQMVEQIKLARLRRDISMDVVCERASISRMTLFKN